MDVKITATVALVLLIIAALSIVVIIPSLYEGDNDETNCGDGVCEGEETCSSCEADCGACPTTTTIPTTTVKTTTTTIETTATTTLETTATTTSTSTTTTISLCSTCGTCPILCDQTLLGRSTSTQEYFYFDISSTKNVKITLDPSEIVDYDLYTKWDGTCVTIHDWDYKSSAGGLGTIETCQKWLTAGTYHMMVDYVSGTGTYKINITCG